MHTTTQFKKAGLVEAANAALFGLLYSCQHRISRAVQAGLVFVQIFLSSINSLTDPQYPSVLTFLRDLKSQSEKIFFF